MIQTVTGPVDSSLLGPTLVHEHLRVRQEIYVQFPHLLSDEMAITMASDQLRSVRAQGIRTVCDPTVMGLGRDVRFLQQVASITSMLIVAATGIYTFNALPTYFSRRSIDEMAEAFVHDIEVGAQGTNIRAAFIKCATDDPGLTPNVEKVLRATARAHRRTGAPIMTHSNPRTKSGLQQQDVFEDEGVDLRKVLIGHCGDTEDLTYLEQLAERGSYLGMDRYGMSDILSTDRRNYVVMQLVKRGYEAQLMLSQDAVCVTDADTVDENQKVRPKWGIGYLVNEVIPELTSLGLAQNAVDRMMINNPASWLDPRKS